MAKDRPAEQEEKRDLAALESIEIFCRADIEIIGAGDRKHR